MSGYRLSRLARADFRSIAKYSFEVWGEKQATAYTEDLLACFARIAISPALGRSCDVIQPGYRRIEQGSHVVFYREHGDEILIGRILHKSMLPHLHVIE